MSLYLVVVLLASIYVQVQDQFQNGGRHGDLPTLKVGALSVRVIILARSTIHCASSVAIMNAIILWKRRKIRPS